MIGIKIAAALFTSFVLVKRLLLGGLQNQIPGYISLTLSHIKELIINPAL